MPGLHFFSGHYVSFTHPTALLAVAILYVSSAHFPSANLTKYQPAYFEAFGRAVDVLAIPKPSASTSSTGPSSKVESEKFDDVLGTKYDRSVGAVQGCTIPTIEYVSMDNDDKEVTSDIRRCGDC